MAGGYDFGGLSNSSGGLAMLAAIRRASSLVSKFAAERRPGRYPCRYPARSQKA